jgi:6-phosphofructokinase 1
MADGFINKAGNGVTPKFMEYLKPLLGSDMPRVGRLNPANKVKKILNK